MVGQNKGNKVQKHIIEYVLCETPQNMNKHSAEFTVANGSLTPLLGKRASEHMNLITVHYDNIANVTSVPEYKQLLTDFADVFNEELGSLPGQMHLQVDQTLTPPVKNPQVKKELKWLEELEIITPVDITTG